MTPSEYVDDANRYQLEELIATGGMGEVWRGRDTTLGREVAIKVLRPEYAGDPVFRTRFETEARNAALLHHPGIAAVFDVGESIRPDGSLRPFLVMELVGGQPLSALLRPGTGMDPGVVRDLLAQTGDALGAAHAAGIVHRDIKPANLIITGNRNVKITDFGISRALSGAAITGTGAVMGTPQYLSPEQARGDAVTPASDVYGLGVVAFECLAGRRPFEKETPVATALAHLHDPVPGLPATVPADLAAVVTRALAKKPADRYPDGAAFAAALRGLPTSSGPVVEPDPVPTPLPSSLDDGTRLLPGVVPAAVAPPTGPTTGVTETAEDEEERRVNGWVIALVTAVVLAIVVVGWLLLRSGDDDTSTTTTPTISSTPTTSTPTATTSTPTATATPFDLDPDDYVGRDVDDVKAELEAKDLVAVVHVVDNPGDEEPDAVVKLTPTKDLLPGDTVDVSYYGPLEQTTSAAPTTATTSTTPTSSTPTTTSSTPTTTSATPTTETATSSPATSDTSTASPAGAQEAPAARKDNADG
ncbi:protein kinase domain-containing protein [Nocardioides sp.]|uniref:protein kinase domain-containing protein n=1 Tax=Nocardioides sp. TaxID=35761 RepID=UPI0039E6A802